MFLELFCCSQRSYTYGVDLVSRHPEKRDAQILCAGDNKQLVCPAACRWCANVKLLSFGHIP